MLPPVCCFPVLLRVLALATLPSLAFATDAPPAVPAGSAVQATLALLGILALLAGLAWLARKMTGGKGFGQGGLRIVGGVALSPRERIVLVEAGDTWLVVGIVPGQIRTLHRMPKGTLSAETDPGRPFAQWLQQATRPPRDA